MMRVDATSYTVPSPTGPESSSTGKPNAPQTDRVDLSLPEQVNQVGGDVRPDRMALVRERLANGFYNRPEVREGIAEAFLNATLPQPV
ncbi:MAG: hypothetical protein O7G87_01535 [bacterium]|nr:hypothetical protein [bacterium]